MKGKSTSKALNSKSTASAYKTKVTNPKVITGKTAGAPKVPTARKYIPLSVVKDIGLYKNIAKATNAKRKK